jgi:acetyl-CoA carboxylase biotin carboxyl carrier protein
MILAPMTGLFYRSPAPGEPAFVNVGDTISVGQIIGLIEAMKVFSEVPADKAGRITAILAKNGELIEEGQPILRLVS